MIRTSVLVVGGGPVGLSLSIALSQQGVPSIVVNDRKTTTTHPKLDVVNCRSMEIFRQLGLSERIRDAGNPRSANQYSAFAASAAGPMYAVMSDRHLIYRPVADAEKRIRDAVDGALPLESMQRIAQMNLEPVLLDAARSAPSIDTRFGWRLYGFEQDAEGVTAMIQEVESGRSLHVRADYLVGCDGPNSLVRNFLNIDYDGTRDLVGELFIIHFKSDAVAALYPDRQPYWHTWLCKPGFMGLLVSPDASRNDFILHRPFAPRPGESLESVIDAALGVKVAYEIVQSGPWRPQFLVAKAFGRGRVFLAGDSTHQYMPTGGLGMNTGLAEAHNLAWKLAATLKRWGGETLLESYEAERLPVARRNRDHVKKCAAASFESTFRGSEVRLDETPEGKASRESLARDFEAKTSRLYESLGVEIGYRYVGSPIVVADSAPEPDYDEIRYVPTTWSGARLPSAFRADGTAVFDQLDPSGFTLLASADRAGDCGAMTTAAADVGAPLSVLPIDEPHLIALYEKPFVLVRPDHHVAWRGDAMPKDCRSVVDVVRGAPRP